MMFNRLLLPSYLRAATPHHYLPCRAARPSEQNLFGYKIYPSSRSMLLPPPPAHILNLSRHLRICLAQKFAPLTFPVPAAPGHGQIITDDDEYWTKPCIERWTNGRLPIFSRSCPISLSPIFEPIANLCRCQPRGLGQFSLLAGIRIGIWNRPKVTFQLGSH